MIRTTHSTGVGDGATAGDGVLGAVGTEVSGDGDTLTHGVTGGAVRHGVTDLGWDQTVRVHHVIASAVVTSELTVQAASHLAADATHRHVLASRLPV